MLTPEQVQEARKKFNITPIPKATSTVDPASRLADFESALAAAKPAPERSTYGKISDAVTNASIGVGKGILSTGKGLAQIGEKVGQGILGGVEKVTGLPVAPTSSTYSEEALQQDAAKGGFMGKLLNKDNLEAHGTAESFGKGAEQLGEFFIPAGKINTVEKILASGAGEKILAKLIPIVGEKAANIISKAASLGTKMGVRATESGGIIAAQTGGDPESVKTAAELGGAIPIVSGTLGALVKKVGGLKEVGKRLAGALSGRGTAVIDEIIQDPKAALEGLTGESMDTLSKDARLIKEASVAMKAEAGKEYSRVINNLQSIYENEGKSFDKGTEINKITDLLEQKFGIVKAGKIAEQTGEDVADAGKLDFESSRFLPKEGTIIERALNLVKSFRDPLTPKTLEGLASKIDKLKSQSPSAIETNSVIHTITSSLRESVAKMGEEAGYQEGADLARNFAQAMDKIDNFNNLFRASSEDLRPNADSLKAGKVILPETEKTKIVQDLSTLFSGNKDIDKDVLKKMVFGGQALVSREAGRTLATATEKASTKLGDIIREAVITPILSPERIGRIVAKTSLSTEKVSQFIEALKRLSPAARGSVIELISKHNDN